MTKESLSKAVETVYRHIKDHGFRKQNSNHSNKGNIKHYLASHGIATRNITLIIDENKQTEEDMRVVLEQYTVFEPKNCYSGLMHMIPLGNQTYILEMICG